MYRFIIPVTSKLYNNCKLNLNSSGSLNCIVDGKWTTARYNISDTLYYCNNVTCVTLYENNNSNDYYNVDDCNSHDCYSRSDNPVIALATIRNNIVYNSCIKIECVEFDENDDYKVTECKLFGYGDYRVLVYNITVDIKCLLPVIINGSMCYLASNTLMHPDILRSVITPFQLERCNKLYFISDVDINDQYIILLDIVTCRYKYFSLKDKIRRVSKDEFMSGYQLLVNHGGGKMKYINRIISEACVCFNVHNNSLCTIQFKYVIVNCEFYSYYYVLDFDVCSYPIYQAVFTGRGNVIFCIDCL